MCIAPPPTFQFLYGLILILGRMLERSICSVSFGNIRISDLDFADNAVIFVKTLDTLIRALGVRIEESELLGLHFPMSNLRSRPSLISLSMLYCLYLFVVRMLRSQRDSLSLAVRWL